jgi:outer membrane protein TolC
MLVSIGAAQITTTSSGLAVPLAAQPTTAPANPVPSLVPEQNPFFGGVPAGQPTPGVLPLSALDAIERGLQHNLGILLSQDQTQSLRGARWHALSELLPNIITRLSATEQQISLTALGFPPQLGATFGLSPIVGPFNVFDARAFAAAPVLDLVAINRTRAASNNVRAADFSYRNARELVVLVVGGMYLEAIADGARVEAAQAQFKTAETLYKQSVDLKNAGVVAGIAVLRAQVEMQAQRQRVVATDNQFEKQKLTLARVIGLPQAQHFELTSKVPYSPSPEMTLAQALARAVQNRADYQQALALEQAAQRSRTAAASEALPSVQLNGDYGTIGPKFSNSHGTFGVGAALKIPIFQGGKVRGDVMQADALLRQRQQELGDLRSRIEYDLRTALLDIKAAAEQVEVAQGTMTLAEEQLREARDRFAAGVADNIDVVQAQEVVATANENYISSLNIHNLAKLSLARALGVAEEATKRVLGGNP